MSHTEHLSTLFSIPIFKHMIWNSNLFCHWNRRHSSCKLQRGIIVCSVRCTNTFIWLWCYIFLINLFYLSIIFSNTISTGFVAITEKKVSLFLFLIEISFFQFDCFYYFKQHKVIVWVILTTYINYLPFTFSEIWFETDSLLTLQPSSL